MDGAGATDDALRPRAAAIIAGVDEAGRSTALGRIEGGSFVPLVVAAVIEGRVGEATRSVYRPPGQSAGAREQELSTPTI